MPVPLLERHRIPPLARTRLSTRFNELVDDWNAKFVNVENDTLFDLIQAANFLDIKPLTELACAKVASAATINGSRTS